MSPKKGNLNAPVKADQSLQSQNSLIDKEELKRRVLNFYNDPAPAAPVQVLDSERHQSCPMDNYADMDMSDRGSTGVMPNLRSNAPSKQMILPEGESLGTPGEKASLQAMNDLLRGSIEPEELEPGCGRHENSLASLA